VNEQLQHHGTTLDEFIALLLKAVIEDCVEELKADVPGMRVEISNGLAINIRISVPQMWTPLACRRMLEAARVAGCRLVTLAFEPQCALAYFVETLRQDSILETLPLRAGNTLLVVDLGCGTGDFVMYKLKDDLNETSCLDAFSEGLGALCGSQIVNERLLPIFEARVTEINGSFQQFCSSLNLNEHAARRQALLGIETMKKNFLTQDRHIVHIAAPGYGAATQDIEFRRFVILILSVMTDADCQTSEEIEDAFDLTLVDIYAQMDEQIKRQRPDLIVLTGGFTRSDYLFGAIKNRYVPAGFTVMRPHTVSTE